MGGYLRTKPPMGLRELEFRPANTDDERRKRDSEEEFSFQGQNSIGDCSVSNCADNQISVSPVLFAHIKPGFMHIFRGKFLPWPEVLLKISTQ